MHQPARAGRGDGVDLEHGFLPRHGKDGGPFRRQRRILGQPLLGKAEAVQRRALPVGCICNGDGQMRRADLGRQPRRQQQLVWVLPRRAEMAQQQHRLVALAIGRQQPHGAHHRLAIEQRGGGLRLGQGTQVHACLAQFGPRQLAVIDQAIFGRLCQRRAGALGVAQLQIGARQPVIGLADGVGQGRERCHLGEMGTRAVRVAEEGEGNPAGMEAGIHQPPLRPLAITGGHLIGKTRFARVEQLADEQAPLGPPFLGIGHELGRLGQPIHRRLPQFELPRPLRAREDEDRLGLHAGIDLVQQRLGIGRVARNGRARHHQRLLGGAEQRQQPFAGTRPVMHHQMGGASPMGGAVEQRAEALENGFFLGVGEEIVDPELADDAACVVVVALIQIGAGQHDLTLNRIGRGLAQRVDDGRGVGLGLGQRLLDARTINARRGEIGGFVGKGSDGGRIDHARMEIDGCPSDGAPLDIGEGFGLCIGLGGVPFGQKGQGRAKRF